MPAGYWAYGNEVAANLTDSLSGPAWAKAVAYMAAFFQILVSLHVSLPPVRHPTLRSCGSLCAGISAVQI